MLMVSICNNHWCLAQNITEFVIRPDPSHLGRLIDFTDQMSLGESYVNSRLSPTSGDQVGRLAPNKTGGETILRNPVKLCKM